jgi:phthiocerol/phenolphthiocerol synthesis type-I polyketide synthase C
LISAASSRPSRPSITRVAASLRDASLIVVGQHPSRWIDFVFGAQAGRLVASGKRSLAVQSAAEPFLAQQLQEHRFFGAEPFEFSPDTLSGPYLLLGQRPASDALAKRHATIDAA